MDDSGTFDVPDSDFRDLLDELFNLDIKPQNRKKSNSRKLFFGPLLKNLSLSADSWSMSWWMMSISLAVLCVSVFIHLFIEMPIATLWSYVMIGKL